RAIEDSGIQVQTILTGMFYCTVFIDESVGIQGPFGGVASQQAVGVVQCLRDVKGGGVSAGMAQAAITIGQIGCTEYPVTINLNFTTVVVDGVGVYAAVAGNDQLSFVVVQVAVFQCELAGFQVAVVVIQAISGLQGNITTGT